MSKQCKRARFIVIAGLVVSLCLVGWTQAVHLEYVPDCLHHELLIKEDLHNLYYASARAGWRDVPRWWVGPWNYPGVGYYRPITSMAFMMEYRAFGDDFNWYNRMSWLVHAINAGLLYLLVISLFRHHPRFRSVLGIVAVFYFATPASSMMFAVERALDWWPSQSDPIGLMFGLTSLVCLDQYLCGSRRPWLGAALLALFLAIATKEMGHIVMPMALVLIVYRGGSLRTAGMPFVAIGVGMILLRTIVVPHPWNPSLVNWRTADTALRNWIGPIWILVRSGNVWGILSALSVLAVVGIGIRRKWTVYSIAFLVVVSILIWRPLMTEMHTLPLTAREAERIIDPLIFVAAIRLFARYWKKEPGALAGVIFLLSFMPILGYAGTYYYYWPGAFLGLANAAFVGCLVRWTAETAPLVNCELPQPIARIRRRVFGESATPVNDLHAG